MRETAGTTVSYGNNVSSIRELYQGKATDRRSLSCVIVVLRQPRMQETLRKTMGLAGLLAVIVLQVCLDIEQGIV